MNEKQQEHMEPIDEELERELEAKSNASELIALQGNRSWNADGSARISREEMAEEVEQTTQEVKDEKTRYRMFLIMRRRWELGWKGTGRPAAVLMGLSAAAWNGLTLSINLDILGLTLGGLSPEEGTRMLHIGVAAAWVWTAWACWDRWPYAGVGGPVDMAWGMKWTDTHMSRWLRRDLVRVLGQIATPVVALGAGSGGNTAVATGMMATKHSTSGLHEGGTTGDPWRTAAILERIAELQRRGGISDRSAAALLGVDRQTLTNWRRGKTRIRRKAATRVEARLVDAEAWLDEGGAGGLAAMDAAGRAAEVDAMTLSRAEVEGRIAKAVG